MTSGLVVLIGAVAIAIFLIGHGSVAGPPGEPDRSPHPDPITTDHVDASMDIEQAAVTYREPDPPDQPDPSSPELGDTPEVRQDPEAPSSDSRVPESEEERRVFLDMVVAPLSRQIVANYGEESRKGLLKSLRSDLSAAEKSRAEQAAANVASLATVCTIRQFAALDHYVMNADDLSKAPREKGVDGRGGNLARGLVAKDKHFWGSEVKEVRISFFLRYEDYPELAAAYRAHDAALAEIEPYLSK